MKRKNVLIIEDDVAMNKLISLVVMDSGHSVTSCFCAETALSDFSNSDYDLVVTDIFMEGIGGVAGITKMRKLQPDVLILAVSAGYQGLSGEDALRAAKKIGANEVLPKPFTIELLMQTVKNLLG